MISESHSLDLMEDIILPQKSSFVTSSSGSLRTSISRIYKTKLDVACKLKSSSKTSDRLLTPAKTYKTLKVNVMTGTGSTGLGALSVEIADCSRSSSQLAALLPCCVMG